MNRGIVCVVVLLAGGCGDKPGSTATSVPAPVASATAPVSPVPGVSAPAPVTAAPEPSGEDWVVWNRAGTGYETRWIQVSGDAVTEVARRSDAVVSNGKRLWRLVETKQPGELVGCGCPADDYNVPSAKCPSLGRVEAVGVEAVDLVSAEATPLLPAEKPDPHGTDYDADVHLDGSVGSRVFIAHDFSGYWCAAHGGTNHTFAPIDVDGLGTSKLAANELPLAVLKAVSPAMRTALGKCGAAEPAPTTDAETLPKLELVSWSVLAGPGGSVEVAWHFGALVSFACSDTYLAYADTSTGPIPEAAPMGLVAPPPVGVQKALAHLPIGTNVGFARVELVGQDREVALARFKSVPAQPWGLAASHLHLPDTAPTGKPAPDSVNEPMHEMGPVPDVIPDDTLPHGQFIEEDVLSSAAKFLRAWKAGDGQSMLAASLLPFRVYGASSNVACEFVRIDEAGDFESKTGCLREADMARGAIPRGLSMDSSRLQIVGVKALPTFGDERVLAAMTKLAKTHRIVRFGFGFDQKTTAFLAVRPMASSEAKVDAVWVSDLAGD